MDEHDDDLEAEVAEGAEQETDDYPDTSDELETDSEDDDSDPELDEDTSEI